MTEPRNIGVRIITRRAGKFTPEDSVEVATSTLSPPNLNAPSTISLSSNVSPEISK